MGLRQRAAEDGEILGKDENRPAVDRAPAGDDAVTGDLLSGHAEVGGAVLDIHAVFLERALVEEHRDPLAGGELAAGMLGLDSRLAAAGPGVIPPPFEFLKDFLHSSLPPTAATPPA